MPPQVGNNHATSACGEHRCNINVAVDRIRESMQQEHRRAITRSCFVVADVEEARLDLLDWRKPGFGSLGLGKARVRGTHERRAYSDAGQSFCRTRRRPHRGQKKFEPWRGIM